MSRETKLDTEIAELEKEIYGTPEEEPTIETAEEPEVEVPEVIIDTPSEPEPVEEPQEPKPKRNNWKKRFINLKSSQDATIFQLRTENADLRTQVLDLEKKITEVSKGIKKDDPFDSLFTDEDKDVVGEEALNIFTKASKTAVDSAVAPLEAKLAEEKEHRKKQQEAEIVRQRKDANVIFNQKLGHLVPSYQETDVDPEFAKWMGDVDPYSGFERKQLLLQAKAAGDVARVAEFFVEFQQLNETPVQQATKKLENAVGPTGSSASQVIDSNKRKQYPFSEVEQFYDDYNKGEYKGKESLAKELTKKYDEAFARGDII